MKYPGYNLHFNKQLLLFLFLASFSLSLLSAPKIDINHASIEELAHGLYGVGPVKAAAIVQFRDKNGPFKKIADLVKVKGIGEKTLEKNKHRISIQGDDKRKSNKGKP